MDCVQASKKTIKISFKDHSRHKSTSGKDSNESQLVTQDPGKISVLHEDPSVALALQARDDAAAEILENSKSTLDDVDAVCFQFSELAIGKAYYVEFPESGSRFTLDWMRRKALQTTERSDSSRAVDEFAAWVIDYLAYIRCSRDFAKAAEQNCERICALLRSPESVAPHKMENARKELSRLITKCTQLERAIGELGQRLFRGHDALIASIEKHAEDIPGFVSFTNMMTIGTVASIVSGVGILGSALLHSWKPDIPAGFALSAVLTSIRFVVDKGVGSKKESEKEREKKGQVFKDLSTETSTHVQEIATSVTLYRDVLHQEKIFRP